MLVPFQKQADPSAETRKMVESEWNGQVFEIEIMIFPTLQLSISALKREYVVIFTRFTPISPDPFREPS